MDRAPQKRRRRRCLLLSLLCVLILAVILAVVLGLTLRDNRDPFQKTFMSRCERFKGYDCKKILSAFQQAYVGKAPCKVPTQAYDAFIKAAPFTPACNRMMFWSKTKDVVHEFTEKKDCFLTLEDTLVGSVVDGLTWCGKEGSSETFTTGCPGWWECDNNPVRSFWNRASAAFAVAACGDVTAMLNGSITTPFNNESIFASIEVKEFSSPTMKTLNVVLVTQNKNVTDCSNDSLKDLQKELDKGIKYNCQEVPEVQIQQCGSDPTAACGSCW